MILGDQTPTVEVGVLETWEETPQEETQEEGEILKEDPCPMNWQAMTD